jgi:hypothetical protein
MNTKLILILAGGGLGVATGGVCFLCGLISRPYRKALNRIAILLTQLCVGTSAVGGLLLLTKLVAIVALSDRSSRQSALYAYLLGFVSVAFFVVRAEILWQRSWKPVRVISERPPVAPGARRRYFVALAIIGPSWPFTIAYLFYRTKPFAPFLFAFSSLFFFAAMIFISKVVGAPKMQEMRKVILIGAAVWICFVGVVAFKSRVTAPTQTSAWLVTVTLLCLIPLSALFFLRPTSASATSV